MPFHYKPNSRSRHLNKLLFYAFSFILVAAFLLSLAGCTTTTTIISEIQPQITTSQIGIGVIQTPTGTTTKSLTPGLVATAQSMVVGYDLTNGAQVLNVTLIPTSLAIANEVYTVYLYDEGKYRDSTTVSWNQPEINVSDSVTVSFPISQTEYNAYYAKDVSDVFSVSILSTPVVTSTTQTYLQTTDISTPGINITAPHNFDDWYVGENVTIEWTSGENVPSNATLTVYLGTIGSTQKYLIGTTPNTGSFSWVVTSQCIGMDVFPELEYPEGGYIANIVPIEITSAPIPTTTLYSGPISINITSPQNGTILRAGETVNITWTTVNLPSYANMWIGIGGGGTTLLSSCTTNTGIFTWVVPTNIIATQAQISLDIIPAHGANIITVSISN
jgi:hypothetical protein